jgi:hypothetical protein
VLDVRGTSDHGRTRKQAETAFCSPNERAGLKLARPDNVGKTYLKAMFVLG